MDSEFKVAIVDRALEGVPEDVRPLCSVISTSTAGLVTRSEKMKSIVENSFSILDYKPPKPTSEQLRLWNPIMACATTSSKGYTMLIQAQCGVMRDLTLMANAASLFSQCRQKDVSFKASIERFDERLKIYDITSTSFTANAQLFIEQMSVIIEGMVNNLPGIIGVQSALSSTSANLTIMRDRHDAWMAAEKEHSVKMGTASGKYNRTKIARESLESVMAAERDRYQGTVRAAKDTEEIRNAALKRQVEAQDKTITETNQREVTTHHPGYKPWRWWWGWGSYTTTHVVNDVSTRVDTSARENAQRQAAAATALQKLQDENKHNAQDASEAAGRLFGKALQEETEAKAELEAAGKLAKEKVHQAQQDYLSAKADYDAGVATISAAVQATGVDQRNVARFIQDALVIRDGAQNSSTAATALAVNMSTMAAVLKQNFEVAEVKIAKLGVKEVIELRAKPLIPFIEYIMNDLGLQDPSYCIFAKEDVSELLKGVKAFATEKNCVWNVVMTMLFTKLVTGDLFGPTEIEKAALADRQGFELVVGENLSAFGSYLTKRGEVISAQLALCCDIKTHNPQLK